METVSEAPGASGALLSSVKYLTFELGDEEYGLEITRVQEIIGLMDITPIPLTPDYVRGVVNLRGKIIPVIDLRRRFGMPKTADHSRKCIIVVELMGAAGATTTQSLLVDAVSEVLTLNAKDIEERPNIHGKRCAEYISGIATVRGKIKILLNLDSLVEANSVIAAADQNQPEETQS